MSLLCAPRTKTTVRTNTGCLLGLFCAGSGAAGLESLLVYLVLVRRLGSALDTEAL